MFAVIETGGKQYRVENGSVIRVEKIDVPEGEKIVFDRVLMVGEGGRVLAGREVGEARVEGTVLRHGKGRKIIVFKYRPKKGFHRKQGHRQLFTEVRVDSITGGFPAGEVRRKEERAAEAEASEGSE